MDKNLYKYKSCDGEGVGSSFCYLLDSLEKKYFYLSRPSELNDKDECKMFNDFSASYDDIRKWLERHPRFVNICNSKNKDPVYELKRTANTTNFRQMAEESRKKEKEHFHIFSLTKSFENEKMWKNYASDYNGICLGFKASTILQKSENDFTDKNERFFIETTDDNLNVDGFYKKQDGKCYLGLIDVVYGKRKPIYIKFFKMNDESEKNKMKESFLKKNNKDEPNKNKVDWSYEKESRVILFDKESPRDKYVNLIAHYPDYVLDEVIFGHKIEESKKQIIMNCLKNNYINFSKIKIITQ